MLLKRAWSSKDAQEVLAVNAVVAVAQLHDHDHVVAVAEDQFRIYQKTMTKMQVMKELARVKRSNPSLRRLSKVQLLRSKSKISRRVVLLQSRRTQSNQSNLRTALGK